MARSTVTVSSPSLVFDDYEDIVQAMKGTASAMFTNQGEVCIACSCLSVQSSIKDVFIAELIKASQAYVSGDPLNPNTNRGSLVDKNKMDVMAHTSLRVGRKRELAC